MALARVKLGAVTRLEKALGLFLAILVASTVWSVSPMATALKAVALATIYLIVLALARIAEREGASSLDQLLTAVHIILITCLINLVVFRDHAFVRLGHFDATPRLSGVFPAIAPDFLAFFAVVGTLGLLTRRGPALTLRPLVRYGLIVAYLGVIVLTRTRSALAILGLCVVFLATTLLRRRRILVALIVAATVTLLTGAIAVGPVGTYLSRNQSGRDLFSLTGRTATWGGAIAKWSTRPLQGFGYYAGHRFALVPKPGADDISNLDNMWIESLVDVGLLGTLPLAVMVIVGAVGLCRADQSSSSDILLRRTLFVAAFAASLINPSLELEAYPLIIFAFVLLGAPRLVLAKTELSSTFEYATLPDGGRTA
ncbi:MAG: O-antigen ligase family protein [Candidatus Dormibacteraeota bacterium]|nr:O-antigen ligase family protein [Candidatus Dormibacteraeota bacterium]